jgi:hypothetical protein
MCDAQHLGSIDGETPERAHQDVSPSVARLVWRRDGGRCRVPGCRSARGLEIHHLVHRADDGSHDASNLALVCSACHQAHHDKALAITGTANHLEVRRPAEPGRPPAPAAHVGAAGNGNTHVDAAGNGNTHVDAAGNGNTHLDVVGNARAYVGAPAKLDAAIIRTQAKEALAGLGWKPAMANPAVAAAATALGAEATLEQLIFEALRRCLRSGA